jgi:hypothetical protein
LIVLCLTAIREAAGARGYELSDLAEETLDHGTACSALLSASKWMAWKGSHARLQLSVE